MPARRTILCLAACGLCAVGLAWVGTSAPAGRIPLDAVDVDQPLAMHVSFERSRFDLDFDQHDRYLLIVGSLSDDHRPHKITLSAEPTTAAIPLPASPMIPLAKTAIAASSPPVVRSAEQPSVSQSADPAVSLRHFHLHVTDGSLDDPKHYVKIAARLVGEGNEVRVYLDQQQQTQELATGLVDHLVETLDRKLLPAFRQQVGGFRDVDQDGKFAVLLSPWLGRLQGGKTSLGGFVRESDFRTDMEAPFSNRCDMMYLNSNLTPGPHLQTLLAHEFMHAVTFSTRLPSPANSRGLPNEEDWLNEAIAHLSENLHGDGWSNLDYRISRFLSQPQEFPLVVEDYYHAGLWRNHGCRGATYLFLRWCVDQFGEELLKKLIHAPGRGRDNIQHATGIKFDELFRRWSISMCLSGATTKAAQTESAAATFDAYRSIDMKGRLGKWGLAGPRPIRWNLDGKPQTLNIAGTAVAFVAIEAPATSGKQRIQITGEFGTKLQVTLLKLPSDLPTFDPQIRWAGDPKSTATVRSLSVEFTQSVPPGFEVESVSFEQNHGETKETRCYSGEALAACRADDCDETPTRFEFPIGDEKHNWLCKVVGRDKQGRRVTAFADVLPAASRDDSQLAAGQRQSGTRR